MIDEELLSPGYDCFIPLANEFLDCIQQELCEAYDKSSQNAVSMAKYVPQNKRKKKKEKILIICRVKQTVFANSNTIFERMATQAEIGHEYPTPPFFLPSFLLAFPLSFFVSTFD